MVLYLTTWQEVPDDLQQTDTMTTTKPEWFKEFEEKQEKRWEEQEKFNEKILGLVEMLIKRIDNLVIKNNLKE
jgi:hypothetical protein